MLLEAVCGLGLRKIEQGLLLLGTVQVEVVEGVFIRFEPNDLNDARAALGLLRRRESRGLAVLPFRCEGYFFDAWQENRVEVVAHLNENEFAVPSIISI